MINVLSSNSGWVMPMVLFSSITNTSGEVQPMTNGNTSTSTRLPCSMVSYGKLLHVGDGGILVLLVDVEEVGVGVYVDDEDDEERIT